MCTDIAGRVSLWTTLLYTAVCLTIGEGCQRPRQAEPPKKHVSEVKHVPATRAADEQATRPSPNEEGTKQIEPSGNLFANPSFEAGPEKWTLSGDGKPLAKFTVDGEDAAHGRRSAILSIGAVDNKDVQFGQTLKAPEPGKTYTFAVLAKSTKEPVDLRLEIERNASPWDRVVKTRDVTVGKEVWKELHVTFKFDKPFPQGWFAYVSCCQADAEYRLDMFRLYEGEYVRFK